MRRLFGISGLRTAFLRPILSAVNLLTFDADFQGPEGRTHQTQPSREPLLHFLLPPMMGTPCGQSCPVPEPYSDSRGSHRSSRCSAGAGILCEKLFIWL